MNPMIFAVVIAIFCFVCWLAWFFILRFDDHWIIEEIHHGHVNTVRMFLAEHHELALIDKLDEVRGTSEGPSPRAPCPGQHVSRVSCLFVWRCVCAHVCAQLAAH